MNNGKEKDEISTGQGDDELTQIVFGDEIDLHHFHFKDTGAAVKEFLDQAEETGISRVRIVHGKGMSKKKEWVLKILDHDNRVVSYSNDGPNWGATIVFLKIKDEKIRH